MQPLVISDNILCPYCGRNLQSPGSIQSDAEHVIGRRFIPRGYLDGEWNLILNSCEECNRYKARLEDGLSPISALSVVDDLEHPAEVVQDIERKLGNRNPETGAVRGATHPETSRPVADSFVSQTVHGSFGPMSMSFTFTGPPQALGSEAELARFHIQGFYFLIANMDSASQTESRASTENCLYLQRGYVHPLFVLRRSDWGNEAATELAARTAGWETCLKLTTARGYFKATKRRDPTRDKSPVFWALEWNRNIRVLGLIREPDNPDVIEQGLPKLQYVELGEALRSRQEVPLSENEDTLFG